jgi:hypothetical protein
MPAVKMRSWMTHAGPITRHDFASYKSRLAGGAEFTPWPTPHIKAAQSTCHLCSWAYNPWLGGGQTPMVVKFINAICPYHGRYRRNARR